MRYAMSHRIGTREENHLLNAPRSVSSEVLLSGLAFFIHGAYHQQTTMAKYFYTNADGQKEGPFCQTQLQELAMQGSIEPDTKLLLLHANGGCITSANQIPGLSFHSESQVQESEA